MMHIPFNRQQLTLRIGISFLGLVLGFWFVFGDTSELQRHELFRKPYLIELLGRLLICLSPLGTVRLVILLLRKEGAIVLDQTGLIDNTSAIFRPKISWKEIKSIENTTIGRAPFKMSVIQIHYKNTNRFPKYIETKLLRIREDVLLAELQARLHH